MINKISRKIYGAGRISRDIRAVEKSIKTGSLMPIVKRIWNKFVGRNIVRRLWWK